MVAQVQNRGEKLHNQRSREKAAGQPMFSFPNPIDNHSDSDIKLLEVNKSSSEENLQKLDKTAPDPPIKSMEVNNLKADPGPHYDHSYNVITKSKKGQHQKQ